MSKLNIYGVRGIVHKWFKSYLSGRHQFTYVNEVCSAITDITCGVPQGSVLGPLLFLLYINDINNVVPSGIVKLFADDTNVFIHGRDSTVVAKDANYYLQRLNEWFIANKLSLSLGKTSYTIFGAASGDEVVLKIGTTEINRVTSCTYLGLIIDDKVNWVKHIKLVCNKLLKFVGLFYKLRNKLPLHCLRNLYYAFVHPHILYGIELYANTSDNHLDKLIKLNNKLLRILQFAKLRSCTDVLYMNYNTLPISELHKYLILVFVHKFMHHKDLLPSVFHNYFLQNNAVHEYETRHSGKLHMPRMRIVFGQRCLKYKGCALWNSIPDELQSSMSINLFKTKIKSYLYANLNI